MVDERLLKTILGAGFDFGFEFGDGMIVSIGARGSAWYCSLRAAVAVGDVDAARDRSVESYESRSSFFCNKLRMYSSWSIPIRSEKGPSRVFFCFWFLRFGTVVSPLKRTFLEGWLLALALLSTAEEIVVGGVCICV